MAQHGLLTGDFLGRLLRQVSWWWDLPFPSIAYLDEFVVKIFGVNKDSTRSQPNARYIVAEVNGFSAIRSHELFVSDDGVNRSSSNDLGHHTATTFAIAIPSNCASDRLVWFATGWIESARWKAFRAQTHAVV